jgi:hypothetical protein
MEHQGQRLDLLVVLHITSFNIAVVNVALADHTPVYLLQRLIDTCIHIIEVRGLWDLGSIHIKLVGNGQVWVNLMLYLSLLVLLFACINASWGSLLQVRVIIGVTSS